MPTRLVPVILSFLALASCGTTPPVHIATDPPGATVVVDGKDTGFITPCTLDLSDRSFRQIDMLLPGYRRASRLVIDRDRQEYVLWRDATAQYRTWRLPIWLGWSDFFWPIKDLGGPSPNRIFVRLHRQSDD